MFDAESLIPVPIQLDYTRRATIYCATKDTVQHLDKIKAFAAEHGISDRLNRQLEYLATFAGGEERGVRCVLYPDFAFMSLTFLLSRDGVKLLNGGLIYSGPEHPCDGSFPQLTVNLSEVTGGKQDPRGNWSVHT